MCRFFLVFFISTVFLFSYSNSNVIKRDIFKEKCLKKTNQTIADQVANAKRDFVNFADFLNLFITVKINKFSYSYKTISPFIDQNYLTNHYYYFINAVRPCLSDDEFRKMLSFRKILVFIERLLQNQNDVINFVLSGGTECIEEKKRDVMVCFNKLLTQEKIPTDQSYIDFFLEYSLNIDMCKLNEICKCFHDELLQCKVRKPILNFQNDCIPEMWCSHERNFIILVPNFFIPNFDFN